MRRAYQIIRSLASLLLILAVAVPLLLYVILAVPGVQRRLLDIARQELEHQIPGVRVTVDDLTYTPFNKLVLRRVVLTDSTGCDTMAVVRRLGAGISVPDLVGYKRIVVSSAEIIGADIRLHRDSAGAPLNIEPILTALRSDNPKPPSGKVTLAVESVVLRSGRLSYDVASAPWKTAGRLDPNHLQISDIAADFRLPVASDTCVHVQMRRLTARDRSGLAITGLAADAVYRPGSVETSRLELLMGGTRLAFAPMRVALPVTLPQELQVRLLDGSFVTPADLASLVPSLAHFDNPLAVELCARADSLRGVTVDTLRLGCDSPLMSLDLTGATLRGRDAAVESLRLTTEGAAVASVLPSLNPDRLSPTLSAALDSLGSVTVEASGSYHGGSSAPHASGALRLAGAGLTAEAEGSASFTPSSTALEAAASVHLSDVISLAAAVPQLSVLAGGAAELNLSGRAVLPHSGLPSGQLTAFVPAACVRGAAVRDIELSAEVQPGGDFELHLESPDTPLQLALTADGTLDTGHRMLSYTLEADSIEPSLFGIVLPGKLAGAALSLGSHGTVSFPARADGRGVADVTGSVELDNITILLPDDSEPVTLRHTALVSQPGHIRLTGDMLDATLAGEFTVPTLAAAFKQIGQSALAGFSGNDAGTDAPLPGMELTASLKTTRPLERLVKLPVQVRYPVRLAAELDGVADTASVRIDAPWLWQGNKELTGSRLTVNVTGLSAGVPEAALDLRTVTPTKNGPMAVTLNGCASGAPGAMPQGALEAGWRIDRARDFSGHIALAAQGIDSLRSAAGMPLAWRVSVLPGQAVFNDTVWRVEPAEITWHPGLLEVEGFRAGHAGQYIAAGGTLSKEDPEQSVVLELHAMDLDYVFETLGIENAMFGGRATGSITASGVLAGAPDVRTDDLYVEGLKYNHSVMGDTHIRAALVPQGPAVSLDATVNQPNGRQSHIEGSILCTNAGYLDLRFDADRIGAGFLRPFMAAFASDVSGYASGHAHLFGTFKDVNMSGDVVADDFGLTLDFTGTTFYAPHDSVHIVPGHIALDGIRLSDGRGGTAELNGWLDHTNFHEPVFRFDITRVHDMLVYNLPESPERRWYGTVYGRGEAHVTGEPGSIGIDVEMTTASGSTFTFVLSDTEEAYDYDFITFRDRAPVAAPDTARQLPAEVLEMRRSMASGDGDGDNPSAYNIGIKAYINPLARMNVIMDPAGGDAIRARGNGVLALGYTSADEELELRGDYTLTEGTYNFTFQDIIRKDFKIREGSAIRFTGDPYAAQLDITAAYRVTANLSDLDDSFLNDPELTRTTVPVDAMLYVTGDMTSPGISYDFELPTLKDDVKRKVNSIVSTDDMRARQMLYLLALSRFYTPDYVSATRGSELFSVASSTLGSQLSNMLGTLAEGWTIAPNIRSDRGDFRDVEVDVALSSSLLNNRLLFNGNFGYRDKTMNSNQFIGDFDIEYLLNRGGSLRLKAYNRYNDQNFYLRNALTTQGVGLVYRRDFDHLLSFLHDIRRRRAAQADTGTAPDSTAVTDQTVKP